MDSYQVQRLVKDRSSKINNVCSLLEPILSSSELFDDNMIAEAFSEAEDLSDPFLEQNSTFVITKKSSKVKLSNICFNFHDRFQKVYHSKKES